MDSNVHLDSACRKTKIKKGENTVSLICLIRSDLHREGKGRTFGAFLRKFLFSPGFQYCVWMRICAFLSSHLLGRVSLYYPARLILRRCSIKYGIEIPHQTQIGSGLYIGHWGGIIVHPQAKIGKNCNISQGVTIGQTNRGERAGVPVIGDGVFIGPGAKILGCIRVGNNVAIGANAVVTRDVPENAVVAGIPARILSLSGSTGYVEHIDYPKC